MSLLLDSLRHRDKEILELKAKVAQLYAVMPTVPNDSFCMTQCSSNNSSMLRLNDTPPLQGPSSPMAHAHMSLGGSPLMNQLQNISNYTSTANSMSPQTPTSQAPTGVSMQQQPVGSNSSNVNTNICNNNNNLNNHNNNNSNNNGNINGGSNLDPNALVYTPKNIGAEA